VASLNIAWSIQKSKSNMTAKDKQNIFIKDYLKPKLKELGFKTTGNNWWKNMNEFFVVINLQNSQWNEKNELSFCFNLGIALTEKLEDKEKKKATHFDLAVPLREDAFLRKDRLKHKYRQDSWLGYLINEKTEIEDFIKEFKIDFEENILPKLLRMESLNDCIEFYSQFDLWKDTFERQVEEVKKNKASH